MTIQKPIVDLSPTEKVTGLACVALSRVKNLSDLLVHLTSFERLQSVEKSVNFKFRVIEEKWINELDKLTQEQFSFLTFKNFLKWYVFLI